MFFKRNFSVIRRSKRQWLNTSVRVLTDRGHMDALGINLSDGGMGLFAVANLSVGSHVQVEFRPPRSSETVHVDATIRHRALYLYGIEFLSTSDAQPQSTPFDLPQRSLGNTKAGQEHPGQASRDWRS